MTATKLIDYKEVAKHSTRDSCWVIIANTVYDVTAFLPEHPGGASIILKHAGRDATAEYEPIHPSDALSSNLSAEQVLGRLDPSTLPTTASPAPTSSLPAPQQDALPLPPVGHQISLHDFETTAQQRLGAKAWAYYSSASDDLRTLEWNRSVWEQVMLRPRMLRNVRHVDTGTTLLGCRTTLPVFVAPAARARFAHPAGEAAIASAAGSEGVVQCVSNNASMTPEEVSAARRAPEQPLWFQLYVQDDRRKSEAMLRRISKEGSGYSAVVVTVDAPTPGKREADERVSAAMGGGGIGRALFAGTTPELVWHDLEWLRAHTQLPIVIKGILTWEDAKMAADCGVRGIVLSNHGGRALDTTPPPLLVLLEIRRHCPEVLQKVEVFVDGGVRRGTDVVKALALGARAVGIGRPVLYALAGYGEEGVKRVLQILREEVETAMRLLGVGKVSEIGPEHVNARRVERWVWGDVSAKL